jgi:hypothetical protein
MYVIMLVNHVNMYSDNFELALGVLTMDSIPIHNTNTFPVHW